MGFAAFAGHKYLNLETFRKSGDGVKTPVWFAADPSAKSRCERRKTVCVHYRRVRKSKTHSQQPTRENRSVRHAWQSARRMGGSACGNRHGRRGCPRNAVAQQEVFSVETVAGILRVLQPARADRLRDPPSVKKEAASDVAEVSRSATRGRPSNLASIWLKMLERHYRGQSHPNVPATSKL